MLAAKTTCRDRWRQVINEADRIAVKHLITLQEGVSEAQFKEMQDAGIQLVVPADAQASYPAEVKPHLLTFESSIADVRTPDFLGAAEFFARLLQFGLNVCRTTLPSASLSNPSFKPSNFKSPACSLSTGSLPAM